MTLIALLISLIISITGVLGVFFPKKLLAFTRLFEHQSALWAAGAFRVIFGFALFFSAPTSHAPGIISAVGLLVITVGLATPFLGIERLQKLLDWMEARGSISLRIWAVATSAIGLLLALAVVT